MHPKLSAAYAAIPPPQNEKEALRAAIARGLLCGYHARWLDDGWHPEAVEEEFSVPIVNPSTAHRSRHFTHAGKFDGIVRRDGEPYLLEHKTCAEDIAPGSWYWKRLTIDTQASGYLLAAFHQGRKLAGVLHDVIRKPGIRPRQLSLKEGSELRSTGEYCGRPLSPESFQAFCLNATDFRETPEMFEARLAKDTLSRPDWYFGRLIVTRLDKELLTYAEELWQMDREIAAAERTQDRRRNDEACFAFGPPCEYLDLCSGHDTIDNVSRWKQLDSVHPELSLEDSKHDGHRILTHTRLGCFALCRRKHFYRYTLGITRWNTPEPLIFGTLLHEALAAWWRTGDDGDAADSAEACRRHDAGEAAAGPHPAPCGARVGEDEPGRDEREAALLADQE
jgi:PD-(D/E)XK nuclease superfamily protein